MSLSYFSQALLDLFGGSSSAVRREILECVSSNGILSEAGLTLEKRRSFDLLAERPFFLQDSRGDWRNFEPNAAVTPFLSLFLDGPEPHIFKAVSILRKCS